MNSLPKRTVRLSQKSRSRLCAVHSTQLFTSVISVLVFESCAGIEVRNEIPGFEKLRSGIVEVEGLHPRAAPPVTVESIPADIPSVARGMPDPAETPVQVVDTDAASDSRAADAAYATLYRGNQRYVSGESEAARAPSRSPAGVSGAQDQVHTAVLACSDAPVSPERLFSQLRGGLFVVQVAGNVLGSAQVASLEQAVQQRGVSVILVLGHESCESVRSALGDPGQNAAEISTDQSWVAAEIRPGVSAARFPASSLDAADSKLRRPIALHLNSVAESLLIRSKVIRDAVEQGRVRLLRGITAQEDGHVDSWK